MKFAKEYVDNVLAANFEDFKRLFFQPLMDIHYAHLIMLHEVGILTRDQARALVRALDSIDAESIAAANFDGSVEDVFFYVERLQEKYCDKDLAGKLHTARSRNDIDATLYRLRWREELVELQHVALELRRALIELCRREQETILPLYTHTQAAQPSTIAHYFLGIVEHIERDSQRFRHALSNMNRCPLGSCAITGTGFPINRRLTSELLAFAGPTGNTYASIAAVDYILESMGALLVFASNLSRVVQDLLLWLTTEFRFLRLEEGFVQPSSIMPQKRNPVALEHSRALLSRCLGQASAVFQMVHNTPFGDIVDVEDDLQPMVDRAFQDALSPARILAAALSRATFDKQKLAARAADDWITMTELADTLVRREEISFRSAHAIVAGMIRTLTREKGGSLSEALQESSTAVLGKALLYENDALAEILNPRHFVESRETLGGPAPEVVSAAISVAEEKLDWEAKELANVAARFRGFRVDLLDQAHEI